MPELNEFRRVSVTVAFLQNITGSTNPMFVYTRSQQIKYYHC